MEYKPDIKFLVDYNFKTDGFMSLKYSLHLKLLRYLLGHLMLIVSDPTAKAGGLR